MCSTRTSASPCSAEWTPARSGASRAGAPHGGDGPLEEVVELVQLLVGELLGQDVVDVPDHAHGLRVDALACRGHGGVDGAGRHLRALPADEALAFEAGDDAD